MFYYAILLHTFDKETDEFRYVSLNNYIFKSVTEATSGLEKEGFIEKDGKLIRFLDDEYEVLEVRQVKVYDK